MARERKKLTIYKNNAMMKSTCDFTKCAENTYKSASASRETLVYFDAG